METKNYYPLKPGKERDKIVSDTPTREFTSETDRLSELKHYGGYFAGESIPYALRDQLVDAYNEKYGPKQDHLKEFQIQFHTDKRKVLKVMAPSWDQVSGLIHLLKFENCSVIKWEYGMECDATIVIGFLKDSHTPKIETAADKKSIDITLTEGSSRLVDVEKVIEDLCQYVKDTQYHRPECLNNGEAALGMLKAFKQERVWKTGEVNSVTGKPKSKLASPQERDRILDEVKAQLPMPVSVPTGNHRDPRFDTANAILFAIESYLSKLP